MFYFKHIAYALFLCIGLCSCATNRLCKKYDAINEKKLSRVYVIEEGDEKLEFEDKQAWLDYCDSQDPLGYSVLKQNTELFTGTSLRIYKKHFFSKAKGYAIFTYKNGFSDGIYSFHLINGDTLISGLCAVDKTVPWTYDVNKGPLPNGGLQWRELDSHRKEYVVRERVYNSTGRLISFYVEDSIFFHISEFHNPSIKEWETIEYNEYGKFHYYLHTDQNGDTLYYSYESDSLKILMDSDYKFNKYYGNIHVTNNFYGYPAKSFYKLDREIPSWDTINKVVSIETDDIKLRMTFQRDTIELVRKVNDKYHGLLLRFSPNGDTIEKIPFDNGKLHGTWIKFDTNGDTLFYRNFLNGKEHGKSVGRDPMYGTYVIENFVNGLLDGKVIIYDRAYGNREKGKLPDKKFLSKEFYMKEGLKHGTYIGYWRYNPLNKDTTCCIIEQKIEFYKGMWHGLRQEFSRDGTLDSETQYEYDKRHGFYKVYGANGNLKISGEYKNGKETGEWVYYNEDGTINRKENY